MLPVLLAVFLFVLLMTVISWYGYSAYVRPSRIYDRVGGVAESTVESEMEQVRPRDVVVKVFEQIGQQIPLSPADQTVTRRDLVMAGFRSDGAIRIFYGIKVIFCLVMFAFALMLHTHVTDNPVLRIVFIVAGTGLGFYVPGLYLESQVKKRQLKLRLALPDALDMMVVSVEAGLGLDQALQHVAREIDHTHPELSDELGLVGLEMRAGKGDLKLFAIWRIVPAKASCASWSPSSFKPTALAQVWERVCARTPISCGCGASRKPKKERPRSA